MHRVERVLVQGMENQMVCSIPDKRVHDRFWKLRGRHMVTSQGMKNLVKEHVGAVPRVWKPSIVYPYRS